MELLLTAAMNSALVSNPWKSRPCSTIQKMDTAVLAEIACNLSCLYFAACLIVAVLLLSLSTVALAAKKETTIRGRVAYGTMDSAITGLEPWCAFVTDSKIALNIFAVCGAFEECEVTGVVDGVWLQSIRKVRRIDTRREPSSEVIKDASLWALSIRELVNNETLCVDKVYISNFHNQTIGKEKFWEFSFIVTVYTCGEYKPRELGSGTVRLVKRKDTWHYYQKKN